jgi:hypothetical protein
LSTAPPPFGPGIDAGVIEHIADDEAAPLANVILLRIGYTIEMSELNLWHRRDSLISLAHNLLDLRFDASRRRCKAPGHVLDLRA